MSITDELREIIPEIDFATNRDRLRAIADLIDMKHELGRETCHDSAGEQMAFFSCSACGATIERKHPRFCFACGRKVVDA